MRIALVTHHYEPENNAPQRRWSALVPRLITAGHSVAVFTPPPHYATGRAERLTMDERSGAMVRGRHGETIYRVRFREHGPGLKARSLDQLVAAVDTVWRGWTSMRRRRDRPDVIVSTAPGLPSLGAGWALSKVLRVPHVVEMRDAWPDLIDCSGMLGAGRVTPAKRRLVSIAEQVVTWLQKSAAAVVTTTVSFAEVLRTRGVQSVEVIRNGTNLDHMQPLPAPVLVQAELHVVYVGTIGRSQGLDTAVRAAAAAAARGVALRLRLVGAGADEPELRALAQALGAPVDFVGRVPAADVPQHYAWADTVLVSLKDWAPFHWTIPSKTYEALAVRRHITACVAGEAARLIERVGAGDVVAPGDSGALAGLWAELVANRNRLAVADTGRAWALDNAHFDELALTYGRLLKGVAA